MKRIIQKDHYYQKNHISDEMISVKLILIASMVRQMPLNFSNKISGLQ